ncbi:MAG: adenylate/guanylate cyclase domain-containing protein [Candidatus Limnocylindria bacterium]
MSVPRLGRRRTSPRPSPAPAADEGRVLSVMVADLSGSTPLGERLDPEELRAILSGFFRGLSHEIQRYGGTVDKYIGDAVRAVFEGASAQEGAERALDAALAMLETIAAENVELERRYGVRLSLRIGVNTGEVTSGLDMDGRPVPAVGPTVSIAQRLETTAVPNTVHVGAGTYRVTRRSFRFEAAPLLTLPDSGKVQRSYRLTARRRRTMRSVTDASAPREGGDPGGGQAGATTSASLQIGGQKAHLLEEQRKVVTVLFADLAEPLDSGLEPQRARVILTAYFNVVARQIQHFGGTIDKYIGDAVMAVFGAPVSHEDDAARAIHAALAIQTAMLKENDALEKEHGVRVAVRIGVNTGEVIAGLLPGEVLAYTVTGDAVNTAQRIESVTPANEVLVSEDTLALAQKSFHFEAVPPLTLKGKAQPVRAYRVVGRPLESGATAGPPLVGRRAELERLSTLFGHAEAGHGSLVHLHGEAGVGKSRVVAEFLAALPPEVPRVSARCSAYEASMPYALIADLLRRLFSVQLSDDEATARVGLRTALEPLALPSEESAVALFVEILGYGEYSALDPESKRRQLVALLQQLLADRSRSGAFVLTIEDLHWIDPVSASTLGDVFSHVAELRCVVLSTSREAATGAWGAIAMGLEALDETSASEMVDRVAPIALDASVRALILERTGGNPFFIEEVVRGIAAGRAVLVPATVQELLEARLDALEAGPRHVVQRAAIIGRTFWTRVLARVSAGEPVPSALATLEAERFVAPFEITPEEKYAFRHALVQEVVYGTQLMALRRKGHGEVGEAIVETFAERLDEFIDILAFHYGRSDDDANARRFLLRAGQRAQHLYANAEALAYFESALARSADDSAARAAAHEGIGRIRRFEGKLAAAIDSFELAIADVGDTDPLGSSRLRVRIAAVHRLRGEPERALEMLSAELSSLPEDADRDRALVLIELAETHWYQGGFTSAIPALERAIRHAERAQATESIAEAYKHLGTVHTLRGEVAEGLRFYERSLTLFEELADASAQGKVLNNIGIAHRRAARYAEALDAYGRALAIKERLGDPLGIGAAANNVAQIHRLLGDLDRAEAEYRASLEQFEMIGVPTGIALAHSGLGSNALDRGDSLTAREHFMKELAESERLGQRASLSEPLRNIALTYVAEDPDAALAWTERALASANDADVPAQEALALQVLGIVRTARGEIGDAIAALERSRQLLDGGDRHELARTLSALSRARRALPAGDPRRAEADTLAEEARLIFAELGAALDLRRLEESKAAG